MLIYEYEAGSTLTGTDVEGSDVDRIRVVAEDREYVTGLRELKTVQTKDPDGDITTYPLRKYARLCAEGNPNLLQGLFAPQEAVYAATGRADRAWRHILDARPAFVSQRAAQKFRGYASSQRRRLTGDETNRTNRPELVESHGYDVKFAAHAYRLAVQGAEFLRTGELILPMHPSSRAIVRAIRKGHFDYSQTLALIDLAIDELDFAANESDLNLEPDYDRINRALDSAYEEAWGKPHGVLASRLPFAA